MISLGEGRHSHSLPEWMVCIASGVVLLLVIYTFRGLV